MKLTNHLFCAALVVACSCNKSSDKQADKPAAPPAAAEPAAPTPKPAEPAPEPAKPAPSPAGSAAAAAPSGPGSLSAASIKLDALPAGWEREDDGRQAKLEYMASVNETRFPADNAMFTFTIEPVEGIEPAPTDPAGYGDWFAAEMKSKVLKTEKLGDAHYFELLGPTGDGEPERLFDVVAKVNGTLWRCGGRLYRDADYNKIPKIRDAAVAQAKKICASMK